MDVVDLENESAPLRAWERARRAVGLPPGSSSISALDDAYEWAHAELLDAGDLVDQELQVAELVRAWRAYELACPEAATAARARRAR